jgi:hypothetical protein
LLSSPTHVAFLNMSWLIRDQSDLENILAKCGVFQAVLEVCYQCRLHSTGCPHTTGQEALHSRKPHNA